MRIQLIYAHPVEGSFCSKLRDMARDALQQSGHQVHLTDLYAEGFPPALSKQERLNYEAAGANVTGVRTHVERLQWAEGLVLVFPGWWYGMPAILKGYFDRVWVPGVAFELDPRGKALRPRLDHIRSLFDDQPESVELWSPGSPAFPELNEAASEEEVLTNRLALGPIFAIPPSTEVWTKRP